MWFPYFGFGRSRLQYNAADDFFFLFVLRLRTYVYYCICLRLLTCLSTPAVRGLCAVLSCPLAYNSSFFVLRYFEVRLRNRTGHRFCRKREKHTIGGKRAVRPRSDRTDRDFSIT